jgi:D-alanyl-D-alanine carboxypeptidase (penicillin-binding protein 5/6)
MNWTRLIKGFFLSFAFLVLFSYLVSAAQYFFNSYPKTIGDQRFLASLSDSANNIVPESVTQNIVPPTVQMLPAPEIDAESAISVESNLYDSDRVIFEKEGQKQLPIASLTKLMTAVVVLDNYDLSKNITVDSVADSQDSMKQDVKLGDTFPVENFLEIMLVESSNKSAYALSELMGEQEFVNLMNKKAKEIGLENTFFVDPTGLSYEDVSTAEDLAKLAEYILKNYPKIGDISKSKEFYVPGFGQVQNTDQLLGEIPDAVCSKTGFTDQAKGCLLLVVNNTPNNDYLINVVLGADDRFAETKKLINWSSQICN